MPFEFVKLKIPEVILVKPKAFNDSRGFFMELYKRTDYLTNQIPYDFVQLNMSYSKRGVIRGLHYQLRPMEQGKLVTVVRGRVIDVAVDIRRGSPWFGKYVTAELSDENRNILWVPPGFAHGFQALEDSLFLYLVTKEYSPDHEACIRWDDPEIGVEWPLKEEAIISDKDRRCPSLKEAENNFTY